MLVNAVTKFHYVNLKNRKKKCCQSISIEVFIVTLQNLFQCVISEYLILKSIQNFRAQEKKLCNYGEFSKLFAPLQSSTELFKTSSSPFINSLLAISIFLCNCSTAIKGGQHKQGRKFCCFLLFDFQLQHRHNSSRSFQQFDKEVFRFATMNVYQHIIFAY